MKAKIAFLCIVVMALLMSACGQAKTPTSTISANNLIASDPKNAVAYVEVRAPDDLRALLLKLARSPKVDEALRYTFINYYVGRGSGSGFVVAGGGSHTRLVTNKHVADGSSYVTVSFDGNKSMIRGEIVFIDPYYDLAVVELPIPRAGLLLKTEAAEQEDARSVGYPAISHNGSYQIARGTVTNSCVKGNLFGESANGCWIQHSAPIDPGSSGGPLLAADDRVLGVNTLKFWRRSSVFMSVPSTNVAKALKRADDMLANRKNEAWMTASLKRACHSFTSELSSKNANMELAVANISYGLIAKKGLKAFDEMYDSKEAKELKESMEDNPLAALQLSILSTLREQFVEQNGIKRDERCTNINPNDDVLAGEDVRITIETRDEGRLELSWRFERGQWRLSGY